MILKILSLVLVNSIQYCLSKRYDNYTLFRAIPVEDKHLRFFENISDIYGVNFWRPPGSLYKPVEFIVSPDRRLDLLDDAERNNVYLTTIIDDIQQ